MALLSSSIRERSRNYCISSFEDHSLSRRVKWARNVYLYVYVIIVAPSPYPATFNHVLHDNDVILNSSETSRELGDTLPPSRSCITMRCNASTCAFLCCTQLILHSLLL